MNERINDTPEVASLSIMMVLGKWSRLLGIVGATAFVAALLFSSTWFIKPEYKSIVVMYPVSTSGISKVLLNESTGPQQDVLEFGQEEQAEQMLQILNSNVIRDRLIKEFNLVDHYDLQDASGKKMTKLYRKFDSNVKIRRTENMAIKVTVFDTDPQMAADIANSIPVLYDSTKSAMQRERAMKAFHIVETEYKLLLSEIKVKEDSLTSIRRKGVYDYETQSEMMNQQLAIEIARGNSRGIHAIEEKLSVLAEYGGTYVSLRDQLEHYKKRLSSVKSLYEQAKVDAFETHPQTFIVNTAYPAEEKSYPIRWLIVFGAVLSTVVFTIVAILGLESMKRWRSERIAERRLSINPVTAGKAINQ